MAIVFPRTQLLHLSRLSSCCQGLGPDRRQFCRKSVRYRAQPRRTSVSHGTGVRGEGGRSRGLPARWALSRPWDPPTLNLRAWERQEGRQCESHPAWSHEKSGSLGVLQLRNLGTGKCGNWRPSKCGNLVLVDNEAMPQPGSSLLGRLRMWKVVRAPTLCLGNAGT